MADSFSSCFVSGVVFLAISFFKIREAIVNAIPMSLKFAIGGGIGLFLALIALKCRNYCREPSNIGRFGRY